MKQYGLEGKFLDVLVADFSKEYIKENQKFDAIITDPPYGIRERAIKLGNKKKTKLDENSSPNIEVVFIKNQYLQFLDMENSATMKKKYECILHLLKTSINFLLYHFC